jgi:hypothetical protein
MRMPTRLDPPEQESKCMATGQRGVAWRYLRASVLALVAIAVAGELTLAQFFPEAEPTNADVVFGCTPGPVEEFHHADPPVPPVRVASSSDTIQTATLRVDTRAGRPVHGHGFNLEHTLWSCPDFRRVMDRWLLTPFQPEVARIDSGQLPFVREDAALSELGRDHYQAMMDDPKSGAAPVSSTTTARGAAPCCPRT